MTLASLCIDIMVNIDVNQRLTDAETKSQRHRPSGELRSSDGRDGAAGFRGFQLNSGCTLRWSESAVGYTDGFSELMFLGLSFDAFLQKN